MTLASDDEGISRIDLSNEYLLAVLRYKLSYRDLKTLARNSLEYSFLPGQSLWEYAPIPFHPAELQRRHPRRPPHLPLCRLFERQRARQRPVEARNQVRRILKMLPDLSSQGPRAGSDRSSS